MGVLCPVAVQPAFEQHFVRDVGDRSSSKATLTAVSIEGAVQTAHDRSARRCAAVHDRSEQLINIDTTDRLSVPSRVLSIIRLRS